MGTQARRDSGAALRTVQSPSSVGVGWLCLHLVNLGPPGGRDVVEPLHCRDPDTGEASQAGRGFLPDESSQERRLLGLGIF